MSTLFDIAVGCACLSTWTRNAAHHSRHRHDPGKTKSCSWTSKPFQKNKHYKRDAAFQLRASSFSGSNELGNFFRAPVKFCGITHPDNRNVASEWSLLLAHAALVGTFHYSCSPSSSLRQASSTSGKKPGHCRSREPLSCTAAAARAPVMKARLAFLRKRIQTFP